jgi:NADH dehydrogenase
MHGFLGGHSAGPAAIDDRGNAHLIEAATRAGIRHFVLLSVAGARADHPMVLHRAKHAAEQHLYASGLAWTVLRPSAYVETWAGIIGAKLAAGGPALVFGRGTNPINFISVRDVATVVHRATADPALRRQVIDLAGPDNLTMQQFAELLGATKIRHIPRGALRFMSVVTKPLAPALARQAAAAVIMDTTNMTADPVPARTRFPDIRWHHAQEISAKLDV